MLKEQAEGRKNGRYIGIGFSTYLEACGLAPSALVGQLGAQAGQWESAVVRVMPTGKIEVLTGSHSHGQGHETTFAQIAAEEFGIPMEDVVIVHGDTGKMPFGRGTYGSRSAAVGGSALKMALGRIKDKATKIAAHLLEAAPEDIEVADGQFKVKGVPEGGKSFFDVALMAHLAHNLPEGMEPGLEAQYMYDPKNFVYPFGTHIAVVELDADTGHVQAHQVCVRGRLRPDHQSARRGRAGSRRDRPGLRPGDFGRNRLRRRRNHADRLVYGVQHAPRRRPADV